MEISIPSIAETCVTDNPLHQSPFALRPYQREALEAVEQSEARGVKRALVALPTGTGKTVIFAHFIHQREGRALILVHRDELLQQAMEKLLLINPSAEIGIVIGIVKGEQNEVDAPIVVASVQTLSRLNRLEQLTPDFASVTVDEAHHSAAETYRRVLDHVGAFRQDGPLTLELTATPERADGDSLGEIWQEIVFKRTILEMIQAGYLADLKAIQIRLDADFQTLHTRRGDFVDTESAALLLATQAPQYTAEVYQRHAAGRKALVFTPTVDLAYAMAEAFLRAGIPTEALDGGTPVDRRGAILRRFHTGETQVVCNCGILIEGFDEASIQCVIIARPTKSRPLYTQMVGRGTRLYLGKPNCLILDLVGATIRHDLVTMASLFHIDPEALEAQTLTEAIASRERPQNLQPSGPIAAPWVAVPVELFRQRPLHWVQVTPDSFVLPVGSGLVTLEATGDQWHVDVIMPDGRRGRLAGPLPLSYGQGVAEDYARSIGAGGLTNPYARWRQEPVSDGQRRLMRVLHIPITAGLTKGEATDLITIAEAGRLLRKTKEVVNG